MNAEILMINKIKVAVLYGGRSVEHEVSIASANNVIQNLDRSLFEVIPVGISKDGLWFLNDDAIHFDNESLSLQNDADRLFFAPTAIYQKQELSATAFINAHQKQLFDVVFPAIHGTYCEDGALQGLLELADVPYVGSGVLGSAIGMDKDVTKRLVSAAGLPTAPYMSLHLGEWLQNREELLTSISQEYKPIIFVKPANSGSSLGIVKVKDATKLAAAIDEAFRFDTKILIEEGIDAVDLEVGVLESAKYGELPITTLVGEAIPNPKHDFHTYDAKYDVDGVIITIPAPLTDAQTALARHVAAEAFRVLEISGFARVDLFFDKNSGKIYFNEINTLPGLTSTSMFPKLLSASGMKHSDVYTVLIELAIKKHARKQALCRDYVES
jgi:D-alanine-D-alanine ligase